MLATPQDLSKGLPLVVRTAQDDLGVNDMTQLRALKVEKLWASGCQIGS